ncbi:hypothetical protein [Sphaerisporangium perillae]|uniref:hypothetical protein n=1 Tax=Sphaerisporangium perillae TaxID=2935860 RepID=UPI00200E5BE4|nr:hypothetical protein [Sphaerisporangium perillae]
MAFFGAYVVLCLTLPGLLLVRALYGGARTLAEEIALGLALGYAIEIFAYIAARAVGTPLLVLIWPVTIYVAFLAHPRLRTHWKGQTHLRAPLWWSWFLALMLVYLIGSSALMFFRVSALTWPEAGTSNLDLSYSLALLGELKHHMPPRVPMVASEHLYYHWFVYAHYAASSWITGVEPLVLLFRLSLLPVLAAFVVLIGMVGQRVIGSWAGALLAVAGTLFVAIPSLYANANGLLLWTGSPQVPWISPTTTFGAMMFAPVVLLLIDLLERRRTGITTWALLAIFLAAVMGAKATYLPVLLAGLAAVAAVEAARRRRLPRPAFVAMGMALACLGYAQFVLFGRVRQGLAVDPLSMVRSTWGALTGMGEQATPPASSTAGVTLLYLMSWAVVWCGILGLLRRPRLLLRPAVVLMLGMSAAASGAVLLLGSTHSLNQAYFLKGAFPYLAILSANGFLVLARRERVSALAAVCAACAGAAVAYVIRLLCHVEVPLRPGRTDTDLYLPYLALAAVGVLATGVVLSFKRRPRPFALLVAMAVGAGPVAAWQARVSLVARHAPGLYESRQVDLDQVPRGALTAARWLRDHSRPDDLIATNAHCRWGYESPCDARHFWVAALTERRVLVEGWAFTATNLDLSRPGELVEQRPFWDQQRLRLNEAVFRTPSAAAIKRLRELYGVRWLLADERQLSPGTRIDEFADFRLRYGDYAIYRVPDGTRS